MIEVTSSAQSEFQRIMQDEGKSCAGIRLGVKGGGCSGYSYIMDFVKDPKDNDTVFNESQTPIYIDPKSLDLIDGVVIDFSADMLNRGFKFKNPNATQACGCGTSFAV